ncbi:putative integral membrane protein [Leishmania donovani]|uniref:Putative integral membrane protein n=2 Tax=Leishmania donovani TaxID=5661 RepID=A0A504X4S6_LEIDO|nr:putative integral membrane protein [Leishmania donovani]
MAHTLRTHPQHGRGALLAAPDAVTRVSMLLLSSALFLSCVVPAMTSTTFMRMAYAATAAEPPRCHVDRSRYTGRTTSKGSWAGLHFHLVFTLGLCTSDPDDGVMSVQLNDRHVNFTGRSGSVAMPHLGLVRFNLSASTIGPQYFTSELCYSDVNCTNLCTDALMGHVRACKVDRAIMPVIIVLFWMVTAVACIGFLAALYLRKLAEQRQKALHQLPEVFGTSPAASRTWRPQQRAPTTPRSLSSSHAVFADDHKASHGGSHEADLEHAFEAPAVIPMQGNDESLTPQLRSTASSATTTSCGLPKREEIEMAALRAVAPPSRQHPSKKHRHTHTHDDEVTGTTTMSLRQARHSGPDLPASTATLDTIILHYSTHTLMLQPDRKNIAYQLNCSAQQQQPKKNRVQALEHAARLRAELEAAEEAARLGAEHEAEQTRVQALEHAARLRAELEAAEEDEKDVRAATSSYNEEYKERILAKARPDPRMRLPRPFIGLSLLEDVEKGTLIVDGLYRDGPAYQTGIRLGDVLLRIAGVYVDSIAKVRQVVDARCRCGCVVPVTLSTKMNQQYSVALWIMTVDPQHNDKPFFFDVHMHHRIESSQIGKKAPWVEVLESPSVSSAVTPLVPLLREPTPRRGSELRSSARSAFVATSYFSMARRSLSSESEQPRGSSSVATAEEAVEASALAPRGYTPPNNVRRHS